MPLKCSVSLINQVSWIKKCPPSYRDSAMASLVNALERRSDDQSKAQPYRERGEKVENMVNNILRASEAEWQKAKESIGKHSPQLVATLDEIRKRPYQLQQWLSLTLNAEETGVGQDVVFWGKTDIEVSDIIYDIKTCVKFSETKYSASLQHHVYMGAKDQMAIPKAVNFKYMVFDCGPLDSPYRPEYHEVDIQHGLMHKEFVLEAYKEFIEYIKFSNLWDLYVQYSTTKG